MSNGFGKKTGLYLSASELDLSDALMAEYEQIPAARPGASTSGAQPGKQKSGGCYIIRLMAFILESDAWPDGF